MIETCPNCEVRQKSDTSRGAGEKVTKELRGAMAKRCLEMCVMNEDPGFPAINTRDGELETAVEVNALGSPTGRRAVYKDRKVVKIIDVKRNTVKVL